VLDGVLGCMGLRPNPRPLFEKRGAKTFNVDEVSANKADDALL